MLEILLWQFFSAASMHSNFISYIPQAPDYLKNVGYTDQEHTNYGLFDLELCL